MTRRGGQLSWGGRNGGNLYGGPRRGGAARALLLGLIVLAVVVLFYFAYRQLFGGGSDCTQSYCASGSNIPAPDGYERVTDVYELKAGSVPLPANSTLGLEFPLARGTTDSRNLSFYQYLPETRVWEPLAPATLQGGKVAGTLASQPRQVAVLRRISAAGHVVAYLPKDGALNSAAAGKVTVLHTRDFKPAADGTVEGTKSTIQVPPGVAWYPSIFSEAADKSSVAIVNGILASAASRTLHVQAIVKLVNDNKLAGIDIAYLDLQPGDRTGFTLFVNELSSALRAQGKVLTLTLPPPVIAQDRVDEGAYDWPQLGKAADILQIWPYRDQSTYRQAMPRVLEYLRGAVDPSKLVLTVSPYATEKTVEGVRTMPLTEAMVIATTLSIRAGAEGKVTTSSNVQVVGVNIDRDENLTGIKWSPETASVYFTYKLGTGRTVWIENFFSIGFKLEYITRYGLGGVGIEDASDNVHLGNIWPALEPFITSGQPILLQPNPADLEPAWNVSNGSKEGGSRGVLTWATPPEPGTYTITLTLSDGVALFENQISVQVQPRQAPATPTAGGG